MMELVSLPIKYLKINDNNKGIEKIEIMNECFCNIFSDNLRVLYIHLLHRIILRKSNICIYKWCSWDIKLQLIPDIVTVIIYYSCVVTISPKDYICITTFKAQENLFVAIIVICIFKTYLRRKNLVFILYLHDISITVLCSFWPNHDLVIWSNQYFMHYLLFRDIRGFPFVFICIIKSYTFTLIM